MSFSRHARIRIHHQALRHNLQYVKKIAPQAKTMPALKANAYGHGLVATATTLADIADGFMLACLGEALVLREAQITLPLMVIQGAQSIADLQLATEKKIRLVIHDVTQLQRLDHFMPKNNQQLAVTLKLDTGMHRLGLRPDSVQMIYQQLKQHPAIDNDIWLMSHFACADERDNPLTTQQITCFDQYTAQLDAPKSLANSAAILAWPDSHRDWVRPGIMLYGASPFATPKINVNVKINKAGKTDKTGKYVQQPHQYHQLQATMTLNAPLVAIHPLKKGDAIGYGATWRCPEAMLVGVVACGYADGYPRHISTDVPVWLNGQYCTILGRVSMDVVVIDLRHVMARIGDRVELWGQYVSVDHIAACADTISYELLCHAGNSQHAFG